MKSHSHSLPVSVRAALAAAALAVAGAAEARTRSDLATPDRRRIVVEMAVRLAKPVHLAPLPPNPIVPFAPPGFDEPDPDEVAAARAAAASAAAGAASHPSAPPTDREMLELIAAKVSPSGTIMMDDRPMLMFGKKFVKVGAHFTVTYKGSDYDLELIAVDRTTFTLRLNREDITRPIQPGKSQ